MKISAVFPVIQDPKAEVLLVHCLDPHFEKAWTGLPQALGLEPGESATISIAGGPLPLAYPENCRSRAKQTAQQLLFARDKFSNAKRCILFTHDNCAYYCTIPQHRTGREDLPLAGSLAKSLFPHWEIELQHVTLFDHGRQIRFDEIAISEKIIRPPTHWFKYHKLVHAS
jgi:hypothetical protein